jgi:hypothetical protein
MREKCQLRCRVTRVTGLQWAAVLKPYPSAMQFSETVLAAMIGAVATMSTALFQIYSALRSRNKFEVKPKKGRTARSIVSVIALMIASGVGGFLYSELRQQHAADDIRGMRDELNAKLQTLAATTERLAAHELAMQTVAPKPVSADLAADVESIVYAPACQGAACAESNAQRLTLCGVIPATSRVNTVQLFAKPAGSSSAWQDVTTNFEADIGGAKFVGAPNEHSEDPGHKAVCVDFLHWSAEPHLARVVLHYESASYGTEQSQPAMATTQSLPAHVVSMAPSSGAP